MRDLEHDSCISALPLANPSQSLEIPYSLVDVAEPDGAGGQVRWHLDDVHDGQLALVLLGHEGTELDERGVLEVRHGH